MKNEYLEIRKKLEERIRNDRFRMPLPTLRVLAKEFGCSAPTVMRAVQGLVSQGLLIPRPCGGYVPSSYGISNTKTAAVIIGSGMHLYEDTYSCRMAYNAVYSLTMTMPDKKHVGVKDLYLNSFDDLTVPFFRQFYSGIILAAPVDQIRERIDKISREISIPYGVFGGLIHTGNVSSIFDIGNNSREVAQKLAERGRRRILVLSAANHPWNRPFEESLRSCGKFEYVEILDDPEAAPEYVAGNIGGKGKNYDSIVFVMHIYRVYDVIRRTAPECLCIMPIFEAECIPDFHGLVMNFDVEAAGEVFGRAMHDAMWGPPGGKPVRNVIPFDLREI